MHRKVFIIEDDEHMIANLSELLEFEGFLVESTSDSRSAVDHVRSFQPHLILSDIRLPGIDGFTILDTLRLDPQTADIPFVFLSGRNDSTLIRSATEHGANGYLVKPFDIRQLLTLIDHLLV
ncbi:MAG: response regulator [Anaerolineae bacterium]|nr:response regulator [Anaerolineae bacterium]